MIAPAEIYETVITDLTSSLRQLEPLEQQAEAHEALTGNPYQATDGQAKKITHEAHHLRLKVQHVTRTLRNAINDVRLAQAELAALDHGENVS